MGNWRTPEDGKKRGASQGTEDEIMPVPKDSKNNEK